MMTIEILKDFFMWCSIINLALMTFSWIMFWMAHDWIYKFHSRWFKFPIPQFDALLYGIFGFYKISIFLFNLVPFIALLIID